jgi:ABC-type antimicrobial peptide transport system permease subunit
LKTAAATLDPNLTVEFRSLTDEIEDGIQQKSSAARMGTLFGLFAGLLAMIGVYGVTSYAASQRTREIGIRMTLGAQRDHVLRLILSETALAVILGIFLGIPTGLAGSRMIRGFLWGVAPSDVQTFVSAVCLIILVAFAAAFLPAHRATRVDPIICLRYE